MNIADMSPLAGPMRRLRSPPGGSTLMTSAPWSASSAVHIGPDSTADRSSTRMPCSGWLEVGSVIACLRTAFMRGQRVPCYAQPRRCRYSRSASDTDGDKLMYQADLMKGQRILVTGGGTGLGQAMAERSTTTPRRPPAARSCCSPPRHGIALEYAGRRPVHRRAHAAAVRAINPNHLVPVLEDGDFRLTESSAILKYLADKIGLAALPEGPAAARARQRDAWTGSTPSCAATSPTASSTRRSSRATSAAATEVQAGHVAWGKERAQAWLKVLDEQHPRHRQRLPVRRRRSRIADYYAASFVALAELTGSDLAAYPERAGAGSAA